MTGAERGWLLLCADLGDGLTPLTLPQVRVLRSAVRAREMPGEPQRELSAPDLRTMGYSDDEAERILRLLDRDRVLDDYLALAAEFGIRPITRLSPEYPARLLRLGSEAPAILFFRGDPACLAGPFVALVGSRKLTPEGKRFARRVGILAAAEGYTLVSGNAAGADRTAQNACLEAGGKVLSILPDSLRDYRPVKNRGLLSEQAWHLPFTAHRALRRNLLIHAMGEVTIAAQTGTSGGTWNGCVENLKRNLSLVFVRRDGSPGAEDLISRGAEGLEEITGISSLKGRMQRLPL